MQHHDPVPSPSLTAWFVRRRGLGAGALLLALAALGTSCVSLSLPTVAHVHLGHVLDGWGDTPKRQGLLTVAVEDAQHAAEHATYAVQGAQDIRSVKLHLGHVLHAVDPTQEEDGPGSGYGLLKGLDGVIEHLGYVSEVPDASANVRGGLPALVQSARALRQQAKLLGTLARDGQNAMDPGLALVLAQEAEQRAAALRAGLGQFGQRLQGLLAAENPPYRPVAQRYLFGLIRLPSGQWGFGDSATPPPQGGSY